MNRDNMKPIATYPMSAIFGIEIVDIDDGYVSWRWSNEKKLHMSTINDNKFRGQQDMDFS